jgi:hypothetical protein
MYDAALFRRHRTAPAGDDAPRTLAQGYAAPAISTPAPTAAEHLHPPTQAASESEATA